MIASLTDVCVEYCEAYRCVKMMTVNLCSLDSLHRRIADPGPPTKEEKSTIIIYFWNWVIPRNAFHSSPRSELRRQNAFCLILINEPTNERKTPKGKKQTKNRTKNSLERTQMAILCVDRIYFGFEKNIIQSVFGRCQVPLPERRKKQINNDDKRQPKFLLFLAFVFRRLVFCLRCVDSIRMDAMTREPNAMQARNLFTAMVLAYGVRVRAA